MLVLIAVHPTVSRPHIFLATKRFTVAGQNDRLAFGASGMQGWRSSESFLEWFCGTDSLRLIGTPSLSIQRCSIIRPSSWIWIRKLKMPLNPTPFSRSMMVTVVCGSVVIINHPYSKDNIYHPQTTHPAHDLPATISISVW